MKPGECTNASNGVQDQQHPAGIEVTTKNGSNGRCELMQHSNEHLPSAVAAAAATQNESPPKTKPPDALQLHVAAPVTQPGNVEAAPPHLFFAAAQPSAPASTGNNALISGVSLPFHNAAAAAAAPINPFALPQTGVAVSASGAGEQQQQRLLLTPPVFRNTKLRSGKWLREEEAYAELLIDLFEKGHVNDCQNGTTLRAYLSQKLHCAPMRISKKYAGRGIGKMVYLSKLTSAGVALPFDQQKQINLLVQATETKFIKAASPTNEYARGVSSQVISL
jgi:hypothetical protein